MQFDACVQLCLACRRRARRRGAQPVQQKSEAGKTGSEVAGKAGGTDAAAGARMAGAGNRGGTGLGEAASADDTRVGTSTGQGADLTGGDASSGDIPPPTGKGGASAA
jgi:hypothetical protein